MVWSSGGRALRATRRYGPKVLAAAVCALMLGACNNDDRPAELAGQPRGATVAFDSIDGPPPGQFNQLVSDLNTEAQVRRLAVMSRESPSAYRVRGYLAVKVVKRQTTVSWVWDVFDQNERRALRISGAETAKGRHRDAWSVADDGMLRRIASSSMDQLAAFLTSPDVAPGTPDVAPVASEASSPPPVMMVGLPDFTPEAAGIFRIFRPNADPTPNEAAAPAEDIGGPVPLPRRRPALTAAISPPEKLALAASGD